MGRFLSNSPPALTDVELYRHLAPFHRPTRSAITFTLISDIDPTRVSGLIWSDLNRLSLNSKSIYLLNCLPRHIFCDLVFWIPVDGGVSPLIDFEDDLARFLNGKSLSEYRSLYDGMIFVHDSTSHFLFELSDQLFWRS